MSTGRVDLIHRGEPQSASYPQRHTQPGTACCAQDARNSHRDVGDGRAEKADDIVCRRGDRGAMLAGA